MSALDALTARGRVALATTVVLAAGVVALSFVAYTAVVGTATASLDEALLQEVDAFSAAIAPRGPDDARDLGEVSRSYLEGRGADVSTRPLIILVSLDTGRVISNSEVQLEDAPGNSASADPIGADPGVSEIAYKGTEYRIVSSPIEDEDGKRIGVLQVASSTEQIQELQRSLALALALTGVAVIALGAVLSRWAAARSLAPVNRIAETAQRVTKSSLGERIEYSGASDELGALAGTINEMLDRLEAAFNEQRAFVADASHELRTPIAVVRGNLDLLTHPATTEDEKAQLVEVIDDEVRRMTRILEDLLSLARLQVGPPRPFQPLAIPVLLEEVVSRARVLGNREIILDCQNNPWVNGDPDLLEQAVLNIVKNAIEHTSDGGRIVVGCLRAGQNTRIEVSDDGEGIPDEALPRLFDRFFRVTGERRSGSGGSGLGLAITKRLVELHSGTVSASNRDNGGAVLSIELPAEEPHED